MFSCVIPTLWKSPRIVHLVDELTKSPSVGEVIIIDNDVTNAKQLIDSEKVKVIKMEKNIFVNPAWNLGVSLSQFDNIALINDDVNFNADVFKMFDSINLQEFGIVGMHIENFKLQSDKEFQLHSHEFRDYGWGCIMLISKKNYVTIPDDLLIWAGDDWLALHRPIFSISGLKVETEMSTTTRQYFTNIQHQDKNTFRDKYLQINPKIWSEEWKK